MKRARLPRRIADSLPGAMLEHGLSYAPTFRGRATWRECWVTMLCAIIALVAMGALIDMVFPLGKARNYAGVLTGVLVFAPVLSAIVRRLHDRGSGFVSFFLLFIPYVGVIIFFFVLAGPGQPHENEHGPDPRTPY